MTERQHPDPVVEIVDLRKTYGSFVAVDGIAPRISRGEVFGILSPNGAGETTVECAGLLLPVTIGMVASDLRAPPSAAATGLAVAAATAALERGLQRPGHYRGCLAPRMWHGFHWEQVEAHAWRVARGGRSVGSRLMRVVLASASPARLGVLRAAGLDPVVEVSEIDEDALLAELAGAQPGQVVTALAEAKATAVAGRVGRRYPEAVVIGCDSMLHVGGLLVGKPADADEVRRGWRAMAGGTGELLTGHAVLRLASGEIDRAAQDHAVTTVRFARPSDAELEAYLASGEPLAVAGAFTLDGRGGWFVDGIRGDPSNVIGISLPLTRRLLTEVGITVTELWIAAPPD